MRAGVSEGRSLETGSDLLNGKAAEQENRER